LTGRHKRKRRTTEKVHCEKTRRNSVRRTGTKEKKVKRGLKRKKQLAKRITIKSWKGGTRIERPRKGSRRLLKGGMDGGAKLVMGNRQKKRAKKETGGSRTKCGGSVSSTGLKSGVSTRKDFQGERRY